MTDFSKMDDESLNGWIAKKLGWRYWDCVDCHTEYWITPDGGVDYNQVDPPDYCTDWKLAGELLEEMRGDICHIWQPGDIEQWICSPKGKRFEPKIADTPQRAICEAWCEWKSQ